MAEQVKWLIFQFQSPTYVWPLINLLSILRRVEYSVRPQMETSFIRYLSEAKNDTKLN